MLPRIWDSATWIGIFTISAKYGWEPGVEDAKRALEAKGVLTDAQKLDLARKHFNDLKDWIEPAVKNLLLDPSVLTISEYDILGGYLIRLIVSYHQQIYNHRVSLIHRSYHMLHDPDHCIPISRQYCSTAWSILWINTSRIHLGSYPNGSGKTMLSKLAHANTPGLTLECRDRTTADLEESNFLSRDEVILKKGMEEIIEYLHNNPIYVPTCTSNNWY